MNIDFDNRKKTRELSIFFSFFTLKMSLFANALKLSSRGRSFSFHNSYLSSYEMSRVITKSDVEKFAVVSGDTNPIHFEGDNPIVHGALLISIISGIIGTK